MLQFADIFHEYGPAYRAQYGDRMLESHIKAMPDIAFCRTQVMGGHVYHCDAWDENLYPYHSCGNRHCPKCGSDRADDWRDKHRQTWLPVKYFLVTCTVPPKLNTVARSNQKWKPAHPTFLVPGSALSDVFRATFREALQAEAPKLFAHVPPETWSTTWVVHCKPVGDGKPTLKYLTPYLSRVALSNRRLLSMKTGKVSFRYKPRKKPQTTMKLDAISFISRSLQHILPKGFQKVRYVGFLHPSAKTRLNTLKEQFRKSAPETSSKPETEKNTETRNAVVNRHTPEVPGGCPHCGRPLRYIGRLPRWPASEMTFQHQRGPPCT